VVISLSHPVAFRQFATIGRVASFRSTERERTPGDPNVYQTTWLNRGRGEVAVADVDVAVIGAVDLEGETFAVDLIDTYAHLSGFETAEAWREAIAEVHGDVSSGYVYEIRLLEWRKVPDGYDEDELMTGVEGPI
jgi:hypothetical protein